MYAEQNFVTIEPDELINKVQEMKAGGYRLVQICCTKVEAGLELLYSFDLEHRLQSLRLPITDDTEVQSISGIYWPAFIYENEMKDLFGVQIKHIALDYGGHFFKVTQETPWNPVKTKEVE